MKINRFFPNYKAICKLFLVMILAITFAVVSTGLAGDQFVEREKKSTKIDGKCWKRTWISSEALMGKSTMPICKAYEEVLNNTCEPPEKLECNWTLPAGEGKFKKLTWTEIDPKEHWELIRDIVLSGWNEKYRTGKWEYYEQEYKKDLAAGVLKLFMATADMDHDGKEEHIVRLNREPDCTSRATYGVIIPETKQMDWKYNNLLRGRAEIMFYKGQAYMFEWEKIPGRIMIYKGFNLLPNSDSTGSINICQFQYLKGGKKK